MADWSCAYRHTEDRFADSCSSLEEFVSVGWLKVEQSGEENLALIIGRFTGGLVVSPIRLLGPTVSTGPVFSPRSVEGSGKFKLWF